MDRAEVLVEVCHRLGISLHIDRRGQLWCEPAHAPQEHPELFLELERHRWDLLRAAGMSRPVLYMLWLLGYV